MIDLNLLFNNGNSKYYFLKILKTFKYIEDKELGKLKEFVDAFSYNQFKSKAWLINKLKDLNIFEDNLNATVLACWFGNILFPCLLDNGVKKIYGYDLDMFAIKTSNFLFDYEKNVKAITSDIWTKKPKYLDDTNLIINTSCEHMPPMKDWEYYKEGIYVFQSTNVTHDQDHLTCVDSIEDFENQMHSMLDILWSGENDIDHIDNGKRFMIVGRM